MQPEQYELIINGVSHILTFNPDSIAPDRAEDTGMAHLTTSGPTGETVVGDFPYRRKSFVKNPFFVIKPVV